VGSEDHAAHDAFVDILRKRDAELAKRWMAHHLERLSRRQQEFIRRRSALR
jgi:DNA-binding GntR family transcriptional regulator